MSRLLMILLGTLLTTSCAPVDYQRLQATALENARARLQQTLARHFTREFAKGMDTLIGALAAEGGFLDNPLVKILLPPPLGLVLAVGQAVHNNPQEALLEVLINRAAEEAIPLAGPLLHATLQTLVLRGEVETLLSGDASAVTDALRAESREQLKEALLPAIGKSLDNTGAGKLYGALVAFNAQVHQAEEDLEDLGILVPAETEDGPPGVAAAELDDYVAERALDGLFNLLAEREKRIRAQLDAPAAF